MSTMDAETERLARFISKEVLGHDCLDRGEPCEATALARQFFDAPVEHPTAPPNHWEELRITPWVPSLESEAHAALRAKENPTGETAGAVRPIVPAETERILDEPDPEHDSDDDQSRWLGEGDRVYYNSGHG